MYDVKIYTCTVGTINNVRKIETSRLKLSENYSRFTDVKLISKDTPSISAIYLVSDVGRKTSTI